MCSTFSPTYNFFFSTSIHVTILWKSKYISKNIQKQKKNLKKNSLQRSANACAGACDFSSCCWALIHATLYLRQAVQWPPVSAHAVNLWPPVDVPVYWLEPATAVCFSTDRHTTYYALYIHMSWSCWYCDTLKAISSIIMSIVAFYSIFFKY